MAHFALVGESCKGASIIDVDSIGEGGGQPKDDYYSKLLVINESIKGEGVQKVVKMSQRRLWMPPSRLEEKKKTSAR